MKKVLIVASVASMVDHFLLPNIEMLQELDYKVYVACNFKFGSPSSQDKIEQLKKDLENNNVICKDIHFMRNPFSIQTVKKYMELKKIMSNNTFELVHCHTPVVGVLARFAARKTRKKGTKVIYTAHGFHFFKGAPLINWLVYYPMEKICSYMTDVLITINKEDYAFAKGKMKAKKVEYIPGVGIDTSKFANVEVDVEKKRQELGLTMDNVVLLSVGELNENKNHQVIIKALGEIKDNNIHYCIAGVGEWKDKLLGIAKEYEVEGNVHLVGFRKDIEELLKIVDIFFFPSKREGLSVALMEAMGSGLPCVVSKIRGNTDLIVDDCGGKLVDANAVDEFVKVIKEVSNNKELQSKYGEYNTVKILGFDVMNVEKRMRGIYEGE